MNPLTLEWVEKAEGDLLTARREYRARRSPNYDAVCFHAQQASTTWFVMGSSCREAENFQINPLQKPNICAIITS